MKSIQIYFLPLILSCFFGMKGFSQSSVNFNKNQKETISRTDSILINEYLTEKDYNKKHNVNKQNRVADSEIYYEDESNKEEEQKKNEKNSFLNEVAAEVIVEVVVNTLFIIAAIWH